MADILQLIDRLGYPIATAVAMGYVLWRILSILASRHVKFVDSMEIVMSAQAQALTTIAADHKVLGLELQRLAEKMTTLTDRMAVVQELGIRPKSAVVITPTGSQGTSASENQGG